MKAIFKDNNKLIINSADASERLLLQSFIGDIKSGKFDISYDELKDINADISGIIITLDEKPEDNTDDNVIEGQTQLPLDDQEETN